MGFGLFGKNVIEGSEVSDNKLAYIKHLAQTLGRMMPLDDLQELQTKISVAQSRNDQVRRKMNLFDHLGDKDETQNLRDFFDTAKKLWDGDRTAFVDFGNGSNTHFAKELSGYLLDVIKEKMGL